MSSRNLTHNPILAPSPHVSGATTLYLASNLGYAIGAPMQFLLITGSEARLKPTLFGQLDFKRRLDCNHLVHLRIDS